ncbi:MAG: GDCCVxC domain-containing (seleno)protein [Ignavibacteria bacterium]
MIKCPKCGSKKKEIMPENACVRFYQCTVCGELLKSRSGSCCVFCSYGDVECPPKQMEKIKK